MKTMNYTYPNGSLSSGLCCWDAVNGSRQEATFIGSWAANGGYGNDPTRAEEYAYAWAKDAWEAGTSREMSFRVAVSNGEETEVFHVTVKSRPEFSSRPAEKKLVCNLDAMSKGSKLWNR